MSTGTWARVTARTAKEVCEHFQLGKEARPLLRDGLTPAQFLQTLLDKQQFPDAVRFVAYALPKREAVWWACLCARQVLGTAPPVQSVALKAAEKWVADPNEDNRRAALPAAEAAEVGTPAGCTAMAVFFSGGSLGPPNVAAIPPGEHLTAQAVAGAVLLAAVDTEPEKAPDKLRTFLARGVEVASGTKRWS